MITAQRAGYGRQPEWWMAAGVRPIAAYQPKGAASLAQSYINLANPGTYNAAPGLAPTFDSARGWLFTNSTNLNTNIVINSAHTLVARVANVDAGSSGQVLGGQSTNRFYMYPRQNSKKQYGYGSYTPSYSPAMTSGVMALSSAGAYADGVKLGDITAGAWTEMAETAKIAFGMGGGYGMIGDIVAGAVFNTPLSAAQVAALSTAMANL